MPTSIAKQKICVPHRRGHQASQEACLASVPSFDQGLAPPAALSLTCRPFLAPVSSGSPFSSPCQLQPFFSSVQHMHHHSYEASRVSIYRNVLRVIGLLITHMAGVPKHG
ncbi:hypothetical protein AOLI_G00291580 [Acnodon oligacanthus]